MAPNHELTGDVIVTASDFTIERGRSGGFVVRRNAYVSHLNDEQIAQAIVEAREWLAALEKCADIATLSY